MINTFIQTKKTKNLKQKKTSFYTNTFFTIKINVFTKFEIFAIFVDLTNLHFLIRQSVYNNRACEIHYFAYLLKQ